MLRSATFAAVLVCSTLGLVACTTFGPAGVAETPAPLTVQGTLNTKARIALPPDSLAIVELRDASRPQGQVVAEQRIPLAGQQMPIPFELVVDRAKLPAGTTYAVRGGILTAGRPAWATQSIVLDTAPSKVDMGALNMTQIRTGAFRSIFQCGDRQAVIDYTQYSMRLAAAQQSFNLRPVPAASGAKYEAIGDPTTYFWSKGRDATIAVKGKAWPGCALKDEDGPRPLRATGNEPGWRLDFDGTKVALLMDNGARRVNATTAPAETTADAKRYIASTEQGPLVVTLFERVCKDTMTGMPYPHAVEVAFEGRTLKGCGGEPAELLKGPEWVVEDINRGGIIDRSRATLDFAEDGRLSGRASCNTYTGRYSLTGERMAVTKLAATRKACAPSLMQQEDKFLRVLRDVVGFDFDAHGGLVLRTSDGRTILARR